MKVTSQQKLHGDDPQLAKNYGTNDCILCYKHISEYFFMDTFLATKKGGKSSRVNTCCQLFVSDKSYLFAVPMNARREVFSAVKRFAKEVGAPDALICDPIAEHKSNQLKAFLNEICTSLRLLEEGTPWANKAELFIGILKEAVRRDRRSRVLLSPFGITVWNAELGSQI